MISKRSEETNNDNSMMFMIILIPVALVIIIVVVLIVVANMKNQLKELSRRKDDKTSHDTVIWEQEHGVQNQTKDKSADDEWLNNEE